VGAFTELRDKGRTRFDALAPEITWWDLKDSLAPAEVARTVWAAALWVAGLANVPNEIHEGLLYSIATGDWPDSLDTFFLKNGPAWHVSQGRRLDIPVLFGQGITDNLFNLNQGLKNFDNALTDSARRRSIFVGYNGGHTLPSIFPAGVGVAADPCSVALGSPGFGDLARRFMTANLKGADTGLTGFGQYHLSTAAGRCVTQQSLAANSAYGLGRIVTPTALGLPIAVKVADGPLSVSGTPRLSARVSSLLPEGRAFFALSVGTNPLDAKIVQNNTLPWREPSTVFNAPRTIELPAVAVDVPAGQSLFLTVSPIADMFIAHGSRLPGILVLDGTTLTVHQNS
jgi:ABC-2 type transport system ATP-binding protein